MFLFESCPNKVISESGELTFFDTVFVDCIRRSPCTIQNFCRKDLQECPTTTWMGPGFGSAGSGDCRVQRRKSWWFDNRPFYHSHPVPWAITNSPPRESKKIHAPGGGIGLLFRWGSIRRRWPGRYIARPHRRGACPSGRGAHQVE
jgi:hypothetical protein